MRTPQRSLRQALLLGAVLAAHASLSPAQANLTEDLEKQLDVGEIVWLEGQPQSYSIYTPPLSTDNHGAAIIIHDAGGHADWPAVVNPLRTQLPMSGWGTLSLYLPGLTRPTDFEPKLKGFFNQIDAAVTYLMGLNIGNIVLIGHGSGATIATAYLAESDQRALRGLIAISLPVYQDQDPKLDTLKTMEQLSRPTFDIFGSNDLASVTHSALDRSLAAKRSTLNASNKVRMEAHKRKEVFLAPINQAQGFIFYRQVEILGARHDFYGFDDQLNRRVLGWLMRHAKGTAIRTQSTPQPTGTMAQIQ